MIDEISPRFVQGLQANIAFWQQKTIDLVDTEVPEIDAEFPNLLRAVQMGMMHPTTQLNSAVLMTQAFFWIEQAAHWNEWLPLMTRIIPALNDDALIIQLYKQQGQLYRSCGQLDAAIPVLQKSAALAQTLPDDVALAETYTHLCSVYRLQHRFSEAAALGQQARQLLSHKTGVERQVTAVLTNLGLVALDQGALDQAETQLSQAAVIGRTVQQPTQIARILNSLAITLHRQGKLEASKHVYQDALDIIQQTSSRIDNVYLKLSLGSLYVDMFRLDEAEKLFLDAEQTLPNGPGYLSMRAMIANNLGNVLLEKGEPAAAEPYLRRSVDLRRQLNIRLPLANAYKGLAQALHQLGQTTEALIAIDAAQQILPEFPDDAWAKSLQQACAVLRESIRPAS